MEVMNNGGVDRMYPVISNRHKGDFFGVGNPSMASFACNNAAIHCTWSTESVFQSTSASAW